MVEPDRGKIDLDLGDGKTPYKLWYTPGAIRMLCKTLNVDLPLIRIMELLTLHLTPETLAKFVWAGRLWEDRKLPLDPIIERVDWSPLSLSALTTEVQKIVYLGLTGKSLVDDVKESDENPGVPTEKVGAGTKLNDSPSGKSVIQ